MRAQRHDERADDGAKIKVTAEGREGIWLPDRESLKAWIIAQEFDAIHNFMPAPGMVIGADHSVISVLVDIAKSERLAILTGEAARGNLQHALAIIANNELQMYDIGKVTETDLQAS
jgi:hypothetical protein